MVSASHCCPYLVLAVFASLPPYRVVHTPWVASEQSGDETRIILSTTELRVEFPLSIVQAVEAQLAFSLLTCRISFMNRQITEVLVVVLFNEKVYSSRDDFPRRITEPVSATSERALTHRESNRDQATQQAQDTEQGHGNSV